MADVETTEKAESKAEALTGRARSLANLKPWTRETRPKSPGRPKLQECERLFRKAGRVKVPGDPAERNFLQLMVSKLYVCAAKGNVEAAKVILERIYGRVPLAGEFDIPPSTIIVQVQKNVSRFGYTFDEEHVKRLTEG